MIRYIVPSEEVLNRNHIMFICLCQKILYKSLNPKFLVEISQSVYEILVALDYRVHMSTDTVSTLNIDQFDKLLLKSFIRCFVRCISQFRVFITRHFDCLTGISTVCTLFFNYFGLNVGY
jgi:hypothetical protein